MKQLLLLLILFSSAAFAVEPHTEHTFRLTEGETAPVTTLDDASWLVGSWKGKAFGNHFEEVWSPPSAGSMVGTFKIYNDADEIQFYEILTLTIDDGRMSLKVKHFTADFVAWEEKEDFINFKLVAADENALHFHGISFYRRSNNRIDVYMAMQTKDGVKEEHLDFNRVN